MFASHVPVKKLAVFSSDSVLIALSASEVKSVPLQRCSRADSCSTCVGLQDPYCAWSEDEGVCADHTGSGNGTGLVQDVETGRHSACGENSYCENALHIVISRQRIAYTYCRIRCYVICPIYDQ